jgi:D-glycero-D-manno-heptose 1,7-bisphosphate phosphatase
MANDRAVHFSNIEYVFLDRDGVLNRNPADGRFVTCWEEFHLLPGVETAIAALNRSGRKVIVITNQRGIALGLLSADDLNRLHDRMREQLGSQGAHLDAIYVCPHDNGECNCRKPLTGLFEQAFSDFSGAAPNNSMMIGDSLCDIEAGNRLGMPTVFIGSPAAETSDAHRAAQLAKTCVPSLLDFVQLCLSDKGKSLEQGRD